MCISSSGNGGQQAAAAAAAAQQQATMQMLQLQQAEQARIAAQASIAEANMDTESSRVSAEDRIRKAAVARGFMSTMLGGKSAANENAPVGLKMLFGQ